MFYNGVVYMCGILFRNILESLNMAIDQRLHCLITEIAFIKDPAKGSTEEDLGRDTF